MSYRNVYYDRKTSSIVIWSWDDDGKPVEKKVKFKPYLFVKAKNDKEAVAVGIDGALLSRKEFDNEWDRKKFVDGTSEKLYFYLPPTQQFLLENFYKSDIQQLTKNDLRTFFFDIEVIADEFPNATEAKFPITSITIYDSQTKKYYVWGTKQYNVYTCKDHLQDIEPEDIVYEYCLTEKGLIKSFVKFWRNNFPDLLVGYNSYSFDMPYIVHRIEQVFGPDKASKLSPVENIYGVEKENKFGQKYKEYTIAGVAHLDYMVLYKTFTPSERESDSLDYVCQLELGTGKIDFGGESLLTLSKTDWNKFINYNIWDVRLLVMLDEKRKYLNVAKFSAFSGFCNLDKVLGKVAIITGVLAKQALLDGKIISTQKEGIKEKIPGGYVKLPEPGIYENIISVDASSLYPSCIITLNISPETKVGKLVSDVNGLLTFYNFRLKRNVEVQKDELLTYLIKNNYALSSCGILFDQQDKSVCAKFVDELYNKRKEVKKKMLKLKSSLEGDSESKSYKEAKLLADQLDTEQYLYKILLNSTYGALANRFFPLYDIDCAKSITTTGQAMIKTTQKIVNEYIQNEWGLKEEDRVIAMDTDSNYISVDDILKKIQAKMIVDGALSPEITDIERKIERNVNIKIREWAINKLNSKDPRFDFKREAICPKAMWVGKKHYIMHVFDKEGVKIDDIKYSGLSVVKATFSNETKAITKSIVKGIMTSLSKKDADNKYFEYYDEFNTIHINKIAVRTSLKTYDKWVGKAQGFKVAKGTPMNAKFSIYYNELLKSLGLQSKYPMIENGKKIKMIYVKPNKYNISGIAYIDELPSEFGLEPDRPKMFEKCVTNCLKPIYKALEWHVPNPEKQYTASVEDLFG